jgi:hypothetical protein
MVVSGQLHVSAVFLPVSETKRSYLACYLSVQVNKFDLPGSEMAFISLSVIQSSEGIAR